MPDVTKFHRDYDKARELRRAGKYDQAIGAYVNARRSGIAYLHAWNNETQSSPIMALRYGFAEFFVGTRANVQATVHTQIPNEIQETHCEWAVSEAKKGDFEGANSHLAQAKKSSDRGVQAKARESEFEINRLWGLSLLQEGRYSSAIDKFKAALEIKPKHSAITQPLTRAHIEWAKRQYDSGLYEPAVNNLLDALSLDPKNNHARSILVNCYSDFGETLFKAGYYGLARDNLLKAIELDPNHPKALVYLAKVHIHDHEVSDDAQRIIEKAYAISPDDEDLIMGLATLYIECNASFEAAEPVLYRAHRIASDSKDLILTLAKGYLDRGARDAKAFGIYKAAYRIRPLWRSLIVRLADIYTSTGASFSSGSVDDEVSSEAIDVLEQSLRYDLDNRCVLDALTEYYLARKKGDVKEAKVLRRSAAYRPNNLDLLMYLAQIHVNHYGHDQEAIELYKQAVALDQDCFEAYVALADLCLRNDELELAEEACNKAITLSPDYAHLYEIRGDIYYRRGNLESAKKDYERAQSLDPLSRNVYEKLGQIVSSFGETREAISLYERWLQRNPNDTEIAYRLALLHYTRGKYWEAIGVLYGVEHLRGQNLGDRRLLTGRSLLGVGDNDSAISVLTTCLKDLNLTPERRTEILFYLGLAYMNASRHIDAIAVLRELLESYPDHIPALINTGVAYAKAGDLALGESFFKEALKVDPGLSLGYNNLVVCLLERRATREALQLCLSDRFQQSSPSKALSIGSTLLYRMGDWRRMDELASQLSRWYRDSSDYLGAAVSLLLYGVSSYLCRRPEQAGELFDECWSKLYEIGVESEVTTKISIWLQGCGALATYEVHLDSESIYDELKEAIDSDPDIGDLVILQLCNSLVNFSPETLNEVLSIADGTRFGARLGKNERFPFPLLCDCSLSVEEQANRFGEWLEVGDPPINGGMATITKVYNSLLGIFGARKKLKPECVSQSLNRNRFRLEARLCANLYHPNIVRVFPDSIDDTDFSFVMEWMDGGSLASLTKSGPLPVVRATEIMVAAGRGLAYFHSLNPRNIHRDVTPSNILLDREGNAKITDFGIANIEDINNEFTVAGQQEIEAARLVGKYPYMSPEQWQGRRLGKLDQRTDQYSFGVSLYEALVGDVPVAPENRDSVQGWGFVITTERPAPPHLVDPKIPKELSDIVMRLLEKDPSARFDSMDEVVTALEHVLSALREEIASDEVLARNKPQG